MDDFGDDAQHSLVEVPFLQEGSVPLGLALQRAIDQGENATFDGFWRFGSSLDQWDQLLPFVKGKLVVSAQSGEDFGRIHEGSPGPFGTVFDNQQYPLWGGPSDSLGKKFPVPEYALKYLFRGC